MATNQRRSRPPTSPDWRAAACAGHDVRLFFPPSGKTAAAGRRVCAGCPVRAACLEHALVAGERHGVWGGTTEEERRRLRRQQPVQRSDGAAA